MLIRTKSFEVAVYARGDVNALRIALVLPGRLDSKDYVSSVSHVDYLASKGFYALSFDPPGTWESGGDISLYTTTNYIKAVNELIEHFGNKPTLLAGFSRGGSVAILVAERNPAVIGVVSILANYGEPTAPDQEAIDAGFKLSYRDIPPGDRTTEEQREFMLPMNYLQDGSQYNPAESLKRVTQPKLLVYATRDEFTQPGEVLEIYEAIPEPKMIKEVDYNHDYRYHPEIIEEVNDVIGRFLERYSLLEGGF